MLHARDKVLVLNAGSSSLKFKLFAAAGRGVLAPLAAGLCERIGEAAGSRMKANAGSEDWRSGQTVDKPLPDHRAALALVSEFLSDAFGASFSEQIHSVGHRVVHGGASLTEPALITSEVRRQIDAASQLAPLHAPANLHGIDGAIAEFPQAPHVAVFDTAFHHTLPPASYTYALPHELCQQHGIRRYGFHGISYMYLCKAASAMLRRPGSSLNLVICHLGAGSSMCAVKGGWSLDTSMGFTPLEGLMMGSRCGDIDPAIVPYLVAHGMSVEEVDVLLNKKSGFVGLASNVDVRAVEAGEERKDERCHLALEVYVHRIRKYLGAYLVALGGQVDAIVFSAGIGENGSELRSRVCEGLEWAGIQLDHGANAATVKGRTGDVSAPESRVKVLVIPTDEQREIAEQTLGVVVGMGLHGGPRVVQPRHQPGSSSQAA